MKNTIQIFRSYVGFMTILVLILTQTGCAHYQLGSMLPPDIRSVYVPTFENLTDEPFLEAEATRAVIEQIQLDGSLKVADESSADARLDVTIYDFELLPLAYEDQRRTLANEYRVLLSAKFKFLNQLSNEVVMQTQKVQGESTFVLASDLTTAKRDALPEAAQDLGHDIVEQIVEAW